MEPSAAPAKQTAPPAKPKADPAELDQDLSRPQRGKGRVGSLENPEVYDAVPGHVIPILEREFDDFDTEAARFMRRELEEEEFVKFRLKQGVYGQRQPERQMVRVKLPLGGVNPEQLDALADVIERYVPLRKGHITTRQNIQMHHVPLPDAAKLIRELGDAGLSSREGCGNTMRNVTGDPFAGVCADEPFDITPYGTAYVRYFVRHPTAQMITVKAHPEVITFLYDEEGERLEALERQLHKRFILRATPGFHHEQYEASAATLPGPGRQSQPEHGATQSPTQPTATKWHEAAEPLSPVASPPRAAEVRRGAQTHQPIPGAKTRFAPARPAGGPTPPNQRRG